MAEQSAEVQTNEERGISRSGFWTCIESLTWLQQKLATMCTGSTSDSGIHTLPFYIMSIILF